MIPSLTNVHNTRVIIVPAPINGSSVRMLRAQVAKNTEAATANNSHQYGLPSGPKNVINCCVICSILLLYSIEMGFATVKNGPAKFLSEYLSGVRGDFYSRSPVDKSVFQTSVYMVLNVLGTLKPTLRSYYNLLIHIQTVE